MTLRATFAGIFFVALFAGCPSWDTVKQKYCAFHAGLGDCPSLDAGLDSGVFFDGGPPVDWAVSLGSANAVQVRDFKLSPDGSQLAISGTFAGDIEFSDSGVQLLTTTSVGLFVAQYLSGDAGFIDGYAFDCGSLQGSYPYPMPIRFSGAEMFLGGTCFLAPGNVIGEDGTSLSLTGGYVNGDEINPFLFELGGGSPGLQYLNAPPLALGGPYANSALVALATQSSGSLFVAVNLPNGAFYLDLDAGSDAGLNPVLAEINPADLSVQLIDSFTCQGIPQTLQWENLVADSTGQTLFAVVQAAQTNGNCQPVIPVACTASTPGCAFPTGLGVGSLSLERLLFTFTDAGTAYGIAQSLGDVPQDAGSLSLASNDPNALYFAGWVSNVSSTQSLVHDPALVVGNVNTLTLDAAFGEFQAGAQSTVSINDIVLTGSGASLRIWVVGAVKGQLQQVDGGQVLASYASGESDGFVMSLTSSLAVDLAQTFVFGAPGFAHQGLKSQTDSHYLYVAASVAPGSGTPSAYVFGGKTVPLVQGGSNLLLFRVPISP